MRSSLYALIADRAEARIRSGAWAPGTRLPPERELCRELEVSRATLRHALHELEERDLITRHQGRGTFVTRPRVPTSLSGFFSIREALIARGATVVTHVLRQEPIEASRHLATDLALLPGDPVLHLERLRMVDGEPIVLESAWLPLALFPGLDGADLASRSLYDVLREDHGRSVAVAQETIEPVILTPHESGLLGVPRQTPAILTRRVTADREGTIVELSQALLRGDRSRFLLIRRVEEPVADDGSAGRLAAAGVAAAAPVSPPRRLDALTVADELAPAHRPPRPLPAHTRRTPA